ncbi:hypothetical protein OG216_47505 (plasmid) [Streptomycetaceae bacterium NBC_01309]
MLKTAPPFTTRQRALAFAASAARDEAYEQNTRIDTADRKIRAVFRSQARDAVRRVLSDHVDPEALRDHWLPNVPFVLLPSGETHSWLAHRVALIEKDGGLAFTALGFDTGDVRSVRLHTVCPQCGGQVDGESVRNWSDLASALHRIERARGDVSAGLRLIERSHHCAAEAARYAASRPRTGRI